MANSNNTIIGYIISGLVTISGGFFAYEVVANSDSGFAYGGYAIEQGIPPTFEQQPVSTSSPNAGDSQVTESEFEESEINEDEFE